MLKILHKINVSTCSSLSLLTYKLCVCMHVHIELVRNLDPVFSPGFCDGEAGMFGNSH